MQSNFRAEAKNLDRHKTFFDLYKDRHKGQESFLIILAIFLNFSETYLLLPLLNILGDAVPEDSESTPGTISNECLF